MAASNNPSVYNYQQQQQPQPPALNRVFGPTPICVTGKPQIYQKPPPFNYSCPPPAVIPNHSPPILTQPPPKLFPDNQKNDYDNTNLNKPPFFTRPPPLPPSNNLFNSAQFACSSSPNILSNINSKDSEVCTSQGLFNNNKNVSRKNNITNIF